MPAPPANRYMASHTLILGLVKIFAVVFSQLPIASAAPAFSLSLAHAAESPEAASEPGLWLYMSIAAALVLSGGAFAGLTIALMGQVCSARNCCSFFVSRRDAGLTRFTSFRMRFICR